MLVHDTVFTSIDSGWTWQGMNLNITGKGYLNIDNQDNIYLRTADKIFCTYDDGVNWANITENLPLTTSKYPELRFSDTKIFTRADDGNIYYRDIYTGVAEKSEDNELTLYPNPVNNFLQLKLNVGEILIAKVKIYSAYGEKVINTEFKENIDVSNLSPGVYFCKVQSGNRTEIKKFVIMR
jgi:hypothetical protein